MAVTPNVTPIMIDATTRRASIRQKAVEGLQSAFPMQARDHTLELRDVKVHERDFGPQDQKDALLQGLTLHEPVKGTVVMKDKEGKIVETARGVVLLHLPYMTDRHSFIVGGNEYTVSNQLRMKPGVYTRKRANEELESSFNLAKGANFRISLDTQHGVPNLEYGTTSIPLYPVLRALGVDHDTVAKHWSPGVADVNKDMFDKKQEASIAKLYSKLVHEAKQTATTHEDRLAAVKDAYHNTVMDPTVTEVTLGAKHDKVTSAALLDASKKLLNVYKNDEETDDRDSLAFKTYHGVEDFFKERIQLFARKTITPKVKMRAANKTKIREMLPHAPFSSDVRAFITGSQLSGIPTQINPVELLDQAVKVTSLGEGGIQSERAIPVEARVLHTSHLGILDPIRSPENFKAGVDIRTSLLAHRDEQGNLYTAVRDVKSGKPSTVSAQDLDKAYVAFPNQKIEGMVDAVYRGHVLKVPSGQINYQLLSAAQMYSPTTNLLPFLAMDQGNRAMMASKQQTQALPLLAREVPWIQSGTYVHKADGTKTLRSFVDILGKMTVPTAPVSGKVVKIDHQYIYIDPSNKKDPKDYKNGTKTSGEVKRQKTIKGIVCRMELEPGDVRTGVNKQGKSWAKKMYACYGHIPKTRGDDGETVDIYVNDVPDASFDMVYVVHQNKQDGTHDEDKCMLGFDSSESAKSMYLKHVPDWCFGSMSELPWDEFADDYLDERRKESDDKTHDGLIKVPYETNFPFASKTYLHQTLHVKEGDHVKEGEHMADSNFTKGGELALGKNMRVAYMAYYGLNSNDAVVISEGASKKFSSEHMYKETLDIVGDMQVGKDIHKTFFGSHYTAQQYNKLSPDGVIKKGEFVMPHDLLIVGVNKAKQNAADSLLGNLRKSLVNPYKEISVHWEHDFKGEIIDVFRNDSRVVVTVKTVEPMRVGDKISGTHGNKGVVSHIVPDHQMIQDEEKKPVDVLLTSAGVISRINPAQVLETALGKVAEKTGKPIIVENFDAEHGVKWAKALMKKHDVKDKETVFDPLTGKYIPNILVGRQYMLRLFKTTDTNYAARGAGAGYDVNMQPTKGGTEGAKSIGKMEFNALIGHNARNVLKEVATVKSQKNDEFWRAIQLGLPLPPMKVPFVHDKLLAMIQASGIHLHKEGSSTTLHPLTDARTQEMSSGHLQNEKLVRAKDLAPERGGLFDPALTGGHGGTKWTHIDLAEPIVNPIFREPVRRLLGLTNTELDSMQSKVGGAEIKKKLGAINIYERLKELHAQTKTATGAKLDDAVKQIKYLTALQKSGYTPDAYVISKMPVIPPVMRPIVQGMGESDLVVGDSNYLYQNLIKHNNEIKLQMAQGRLPPDEKAKLRDNLSNAVGAVIGTVDTDNQKLQKRNVKGFLEHLTGKTTPKSSFFQKKVEKRTQDISGRGTAVPDGSLGIDQIGMPEDMLWGMYEKFVISRLVRRGFPALEAKKMVIDRHPAARDSLLAECRERPVVFNRAPTLWRNNMVGAYPVPVKGKTLRVNAFVEPHMNLDYDGDALQVHAPVLPAAVEEVKKMTLSHLVFSDKQRDDLLVKPAMEAVLGLHLASKPHNAGKVHVFKTEQEAMAAYNRGEVTLHDQVEIKP